MHRYRLWGLDSIENRTQRNRILPITGSVLSGPGIYGDANAREIVSLFMNNGWLDIAVIGDSNTMAASSGTYGYIHGLQEAATALNKQIYGTGITPIMSRLLLAGNEYSYGLGDWRSGTVTRLTNGTAPSGRRSGTDEGGSTSFSGWTPGTNFVQYGQQQNSLIGGQTITRSAISDWVYYTGTAQFYDNYSGTTINANHPLATAGLAVRYRITHSRGANGNASGLRMSAYQNTANTLINNASYSTFNATDIVNRQDHPFTTAGTTGIRCGHGYGSFAPFNVFSNSIYRQTYGLGVTSHLYYSGGTTAQIASVISGASSTFIQTLLADMRTRQIDAGGQGKVMILSHGGINDSVNDWQTHQQTIYNTYKTAWSALGYPSSDFAFVTMVGVMRNFSDTSLNGVSLGPIRLAAREWAKATPGITFLDMSEITSYNELNTNGWYQTGAGENGQHLTSTGYNNISSRIFTTLAG